MRKERGKTSREVQMASRTILRDSKADGRNLGHRWRWKKTGRQARVPEWGERRENFPETTNAAKRPLSVSNTLLD